MCQNNCYPATPQNGGKYGINGGEFQTFPNIIK